MRIPRSHSMTRSLPLAMIYSALISSSFSVLARPLLRRIGLSIRPSSRRRSKFCMFLAPTWITSTSSKSGKSMIFMSSVTIGRPVSRRATFRYSKPVAFSPAKSYGDVRGLNAPPRMSCAPAALTAFATVTICSSDSTEQGPAIMTKLPPPTLTSPMLTTISSGWNLRLQHLKGSVTRLTESTISRLSTKSMSTLLVSPIRPTMV